MMILANIPDEIYIYIRNGGESGASPLIDNAIRNGIPFSKHEDYPKCSYCTCPNNCILVDKLKAESENGI